MAAGIHLNLRRWYSTLQTNLLAKKELTVLSDEKLGIADARLDVARLGLDLRYEQGMRTCEINALAPLYLKKSEAEERLEETITERLII